MKKPKIVYVVGTRPEIIRSALIILALKNDPRVNFKLVHTGQHYDYTMDRVFFKELGLPKADINSGIGSGTHAVQTANIMTALEKFFLKFNPDIVAVFGDTNSSLAGALTAVKLKIPVAHLEAGCREWEMDLPEEINRRLIDHCANVLISVSGVCTENLKNEKVKGKIYQTGDPLFDVFKSLIKKSVQLKLLEEFKLNPKEYIFLTAHRDKNVDNRESLSGIISALNNFKDLKTIFPVHPRTQKRLKEFKLLSGGESNILFTRPLSYNETINLVKNAKLVVTDSGGLQKEAFWCKIPCITLRDNTAWIETVDFGVNFLSVVEKEAIKSKIFYIIKNYKNILGIFPKAGNPYRKPNITQSIVELLKKQAGKKW